MIIVDAFLVAYPLIGLLSQYRLIQTTQKVGSFSIDICAIALLSNIMRIFFWYEKQFAMFLLLQSVLVISLHLCLLRLCVKLGYKSAKGKESKQSFYGRFWRWNTFKQFVLFLMGFIGFLGIMETQLYGNFFYTEGLGMVSMSIQATIGFPQIIALYKNRSAKGLSYFMLLVWILGDSIKTVYLIEEGIPFQFILCSIVQLSSDIVIVIQALYYSFIQYCNRDPLKKNAAQMESDFPGWEHQIEAVSLKS